MHASPTRLTFTITDTGNWRTPRVDPSPRGHGIALMRTFMDDVTITATETGTTVEMIKELHT